MFAQLCSARRAFLLPLIAVSFSIASCESKPPAAGEVGNVSLTGAGASFPSPLYQRWFSVYNQQKPNVRISYQSIGSGAGVEQFIQGTVDFAASDVITDEQAAKVERGDHATDDRRFDSAGLQPAQCANWLEATGKYTPISSWGKSRMERPRVIRV